MPDRPHRRRRLRRLAHGFQDQQIDARLDQAADLSLKERFHFVDAQFAQGLDERAQRTHGAGDIPLAPGGFPSQADSRGVDLLEAVRQAEALQPDGAGAEGVAHEHLGPGGDVGPVHAQHLSRLAQVERLDAGVHGYALLKEVSAHRAVHEGEVLLLEEAEEIVSGHRRTPCKRRRRRGAAQAVASSAAAFWWGFRNL